MIISPSLYPLIAALLANVAAQVLKLFNFYFRSGRWDLHQVISCGGFPSSHSSTVTALSLAIGLQEGFTSPFFAITCIFAFIVIYDAVNVRYYAGKNIQLTKQLISDIEEMQKVNFSDPIYHEKIKDVLGHKFVEAIGGILLGVIEIFSKAYISTQLSDAIVFAVLIIVLLVKPDGLLGKHVSEKV